jgi:hypothetical protein
MKLLGFSELTKRIYILPSSAKKQKIDITDDVNEYINYVNKSDQQELSKEREKAKKLIGALNEYIVLLGEELDEVMGFVNAHQWKSTRFEKGEELRQKIKQTLNEYDTATKES